MTTLNVPNIFTTTDTSVGVGVGNTVTLSDLVNNYGYIPIDIPVHPDELSQLISVDINSGVVSVDFSTIKEAVSDFMHTITGPSSEFATTVTSFVNSLSLGTMVDPPFVTFNFFEQPITNVTLADVSSNVAEYINMITHTINADADYYGNTAGDLMLLQLEEQNASSNLIQVDSTYSQVVFNQSDRLQIANNIQFTQSINIVPPSTGGSNRFLLPGQSHLSVQGPSVSGTFIANYIAGERTDMDITVSDPISNVLEPTLYSSRGNLFAQIRRNISIDAIPEPLILASADLTQSYAVTNILGRTNISAGTYYISSFGSVDINRYPDSLLVTSSGASLKGVELLFKPQLLDIIANAFTPSLDLVNTYILLNNPSGSHYGEPVGDVYLTGGTYWIVKRTKNITVSDATTEVPYTDSDPTIFSDLGGTSTTFLYEMPTSKMIQFDACTSNIYDAFDETAIYNIDLKTKNINLLFDAQTFSTVLNYQTYQPSDVFDISSLPVPYSLTDSYSNILTVSSTFYDFQHEGTYVVEAS